MNKDILKETFLDITLFFLENKDSFLNEVAYLSLELISYESEVNNKVHIIFSINKNKTILKSIKLPEVLLEDKQDYVLEIDLFLIRLYKSIEKYIKTRYFVHICPECNKIHTNSSMYFSRNYLCNCCLSQSKDSAESKNKNIKNISDGYIYFFESSLTKLIKIGFSGNIRRRKKEIESLQGGKINTLKIITSNQKNEKYLHERFSHLKTYGEWFLPNEELLLFIKNLKDEDSLLSS
jgi:hypothetical protein